MLPTAGKRTGIVSLVLFIQDFYFYFQYTFNSCKRGGGGGGGGGGVCLGGGGGGGGKSQIATL